jgi:hypothetical protein
MAANAYKEGAGTSQLNASNQSDDDSTQHILQLRIEATW